MSRSKKKQRDVGDTRSWGTMGALVRYPGAAPHDGKVKEGEGGKGRDEERKLR